MDKAKTAKVCHSNILHYMVASRIHNVKKRECPTVNITHTKLLCQVFCYSLYIFEKQSIPFTALFNIMNSW